LATMRKLAFLFVAFALVSVSFYGCDETSLTEPAAVSAEHPSLSVHKPKGPTDAGVVWLAPAMSSQGGGAWIHNRGNGQPGPSLPPGCNHGEYRTAQITVVHTPSGNFITHCFFEGLPRISQPEVERGWPCYWWIGGVLHQTNDTHYTRTPSGQLAGKCRFRTQVPPPPKPNQ